MMKKAKSVTIALCTDGDLLFETVNRTYNRLCAIAKECNAKQLPTVEMSDAMLTASPMLRHLEKCYFEDDTPKFAGTDGTINIFCGKNRFSEIQNGLNARAVMLPFSEKFSPPKKAKRPR